MVFSKAEGMGEGQTRPARATCSRGQELYWETQEVAASAGASSGSRELTEQETGLYRASGGQDFQGWELV